MNTDERRFLIKSGRTRKSAKKFRHAEIFSPIRFGCRFASRMNCDELGWSGYTGILGDFEIFKIGNKSASVGQGQELSLNVGQNAGIEK